MTDAAPVSDVHICLFYDDPEAAIAWLCRAFGLVKRLVVHGAGHRIDHSELSFGNAVIMVGGTGAKPERASPRQHAAAAHAVSTFVADPDAHCSIAKAAGARIVQELHDTDYGARSYGAEDIEGHVWYFSNYQPGSYWRADGTPSIVHHG